MLLRGSFHGSKMDFTGSTAVESTDIFSGLILFCLWAVLISSDRTFFHTPIRCQLLNLRLAVESSPYLFGISDHLHPVIATNRIPLRVISVVCPGSTSFGVWWKVVLYCFPLGICYLLEFHENTLC